MKKNKLQNLLIKYKRNTKYEIRSTERGLTLIELLVTTAILAILVFAVGYVFVVGLNLWNEGYARSDIRGDISQAVELVSKNLRQAKGPAVTVISTQIDFTADLDSGIGGDETYRYRLVNNELRRSRTSPSPTSEITLARNIDLSASSFSRTSNLITIDLTATRGDETIRLRSNVRPRNL